MSPVFCTVIENQTAWVNAASLLVHSLRQNGGSFAKSPFVLLVNDCAPRQVLWEDGCEGIMVLGSNRHSTLPHLSKVNALELSEVIPCTHIILLDHDTLVLGLEDLELFLTSEFHARRNYKHILRRRLGTGYAVPLADAIKPWRRIAYFNSGVVIAPVELCGVLAPAWRAWGERLIDPYKGRPLSEQIGLAMAVADTRLPYSFLPMTYNETNWRPPSGQSRIIHYNAYDPINKEVKTKALLSYHAFRAFLANTNNRFWQAHAPAVENLLDDRLTSFADHLEALLKPLRRSEGFG